MRFWATMMAGAFTCSAVGGANADPQYGRSWPREWKRDQHGAAHSFDRIATLGNYLNNSDISEETVSEIVSSTKDGKKLVYTDSPMEQIGFVDIRNPRAPKPLGKLDVGGEPTSVAVLGNHLALVGVNTSESYESPSGMLVVVHVPTQQILAQHDLGGQPDSVAISPDGRYAAIAVENERDEDVVVDGVEGGLPQPPAGYLVIVDLLGYPSSWTTRQVSLSGLSEYAPDDPEPEFVDINDANQAVVSLQENNHIAIVDLRSGEVVNDFAAGTQTLVGVDATEDDLISLSETLYDIPREPDAISWVRAGRRRLIGTANEGDLFGGSRGFSLFDTAGNLVFDTNTVLEELAVRFGHYPESRSENKGTEPEAIEYARFGNTDYLFVGSERGGFVAVFELKSHGAPQFVQLLPAPLRPEGLLAIPSRGLLVASGEEDDPSYGVRSTMMIYRIGKTTPSYPHILSGDDEWGKPIAWSALSGMTAVPGSNDELLAVWDSYYSESRIMTIDASSKPAVITSAQAITGASGALDPEGIAVAPDGTRWIASEGNASGSKPNLLLQVDAYGEVLAEVSLPDEIAVCRADSTTTGTLGSGFEGVAVRRKPGGGYLLLAVQQRGWNYTTPECEDFDDDPDGSDPTEPTRSRIWTYDPDSGDWGHIAYELEPVPAVASWVGLSEITAVHGGFIVIERDNRSGDFATLKTLVYVSNHALKDGIIERSEKRSYDVIPSLEASNGWISDKPEGVAVTANGQLFLITDNDGVDDWSGETWFLGLGNYRRLFR